MKKGRYEKKERKKEREKVRRTNQIVNEHKTVVATKNGNHIKQRKSKNKEHKGIYFWLMIDDFFVASSSAAVARSSSSSREEFWDYNANAWHAS
jgi:hypothetical protein